MTNNENSKHAAELHRLEAESKKFQAEALKAESEARQIQQDLERPWYRKPLFLQAVAAGLVAVPLVWFYVTEVAIPLFQSENVKLVREIEESRSLLREEKVQNELAVKLLVEEKEQASRELLAKFNDLRERSENLEKLRNAISEQYETLLSAHDITKADRDRLEREYNQVQTSLIDKAKELTALNNEIAKLQSESDNAGQRFADELQRLQGRIPGGTTLYQNSLAVIIGVDSSTDERLSFLPGVRKDTEAIASVLEKQGFETNTLLNPSRDQVQEALDNLRRRAGEQDRAIIYWSGHGITSSESGVRRGYLATSDCSLEHVYEHCFPMEAIPDIVERIGAKSVLAMVDASHAGLALPSTRGIRLISPYAPHFSKEVIAASDRSGLTFDMSRAGLGPFAAGFVEGIGSFRADFNEDGVIRTAELFHYISTRVVQLTSGRQVPAYAALAPNAGEMLFASSENSKDERKGWR